MAYSRKLRPNLRYPVLGVDRGIATNPGRAAGKQQQPPIQGGDPTVKGGSAHGSSRCEQHAPLILYCVPVEGHRPFSDSAVEQLSSETSEGC